MNAHAADQNQTETARLVLGLSPETPLLLCLASPETLSDRALDLASRALSCCPQATLIFCRDTFPRSDKVQSVCLSDDFPKSLPWIPKLPTALQFQEAPAHRCMVLEHEKSRELFAALLDEAAVLLDFPDGDDDKAVLMALSAGVPVVSASPHGKKALAQAGLAELIPEHDDAFVELAVNLAADPAKLELFRPHIARAQQALHNPLTVGARHPLPPLPGKITADYDPDAWFELTIETPGRPNREFRTRGLDVQGQVGTFFGRHRSGWEYVVEMLGTLHNPSALYFESFIERRFAWGNWCNMPGSPVFKPWVGIFHVPPVLPEWFGTENTISRIMETEHWQRSLPYCRGFFTLTNWLKEQLRPYTDLPIEVLRHPTDLNVTPWSADKFIHNPARALVQVGNTYRNLHSLALLPPHPLVRMALMGNAQLFHNLHAAEEEEFRKAGLPFESGAEVHLMDFVSNDVYDALFTENVLFADYYTASASNLVVECMARATPLLVNKLEPIVEYLGEDYPLYFESYTEAAEKLHDTDRIVATHEYLCRWNRGILDRTTFVYDILQSDIIRRQDI